MKWRKTKRGYIQIRFVDGRDGNEKWLDEHRVVMEEMLNRALRSNEIVHHIDKNRENNSPHNLEVLSVREHFQRHRRPAQKMHRKILSLPVWMREGLGILAVKRKTSIAALIREAIKKSYPDDEIKSINKEQDANVSDR